MAGVQGALILKSLLIRPTMALRESLTLEEEGRRLISSTFGGEVQISYPSLEWDIY